MDGSNWPIVLIEIVLVFGGVLAFGWWQLRDLDRERRKRIESEQAGPASRPAAAREQSPGTPPDRTPSD